LSERVFLLLFLMTAVLISVGNYYNSAEGAILNGAWRMYNGDTLYSDFFSYIAPGSYWWTELSFFLLGPSYLSARIFSVLLLTLSVAAIYHITIMSGGSRTAGLIASSLWYLSNMMNTMLINHNSHSSYWAAISLFFMISAVLDKKSHHFFFAGLFTGVTVAALQTKGFVLTCALGTLSLVYLFTKTISKRDILLFFLGCLIVPALVLHIWDPTFLYETLIRWPTEHYVEINKISKLGWSIALATSLAMPFLISAYVKAANTKVLWMISVTQVFLIFGTLNRPDYFHIILAIFGSMVLASLALEQWLTHLRERLGNRVMDEPRKIALVSILSITTLMSISIGWQALERERSFKADALVLGTVEKIYAHPFIPGLYFELGVNNPYRYDFLFTGMYPQEAFLDNLSQLRLENPPYVLVQYRMVEEFNYDTNNPLDAYIEERYEPTGEDILGVTVLKKRP